MHACAAQAVLRRSHKGTRLRLPTLTVFAPQSRRKSAGLKRGRTRQRTSYPSSSALHAHYVYGDMRAAPSMQRCGSRRNSCVGWAHAHAARCLAHPCLTQGGPLRTCGRFAARACRSRPLLGWCSSARESRRLLRRLRTPGPGSSGSLQQQQQGGANTVVVVVRKSWGASMQDPVCVCGTDARTTTPLVSVRAHLSSGQG